MRDRDTLRVGKRREAEKSACKPNQTAACHYGYRCRFRSKLVAPARRSRGHLALAFGAFSRSKTCQTRIQFPAPLSRKRTAPIGQSRLFGLNQPAGKADLPKTRDGSRAAVRHRSNPMSAHDAQPASRLEISTTAPSSHMDASVYGNRRPMGTLAELLGSSSSVPSKLEGQSSALLAQLEKALSDQQGRGLHLRS